jgi:hypothetical protein
MRSKCVNITRQIAARWDDANPPSATPTAPEGAAELRAARRVREVPQTEHVLAIWMLLLTPLTDQVAEVSALLTAQGISPGAVAAPVVALIRRSEARAEAAKTRKIS